MGERARVFIDYWNFQLNWNERAEDARCDWVSLPRALIRSVERVLDGVELSHEGTLIYASVDPANENLLGWLETFLSRQTGFVVRIARLLRRQRAVRCASCGCETEACPECGEPLTVTTTKGLATQMVVDMMSLCNGGGCDVPILVSSDTELAPAVRYLVDRGVKVIHAGWRDVGGELTREAWASVELDPLIGELVRS